MLLERGLLKKPVALSSWESSVFDLPEPFCQEVYDEHVHLFTDGSADGVQTVPSSSWAVILQEPGSFNRALVASGLVPGLQSNYRAELYAAIVAVQSAACATIYVDNQAVCDGCNLLKTRGWLGIAWDKKSEFSLWKQLAVLLQGRAEQFSFIHVRSHRTVVMQPTDFLAWTAAGNNAADEAAKGANQLRPLEQSRLLKLARHEWKNKLARLQNVAALQQGIMLAQSADNTKPTSASASGDFSVKLGNALSFQRSPGDDFADALLGSRFSWVLASWWNKQ